MARLFVLVALFALALRPCECTGVAGAAPRPVTKIINMMKDMLTQLDAEAKEDDEVYEAMGCWCESNDREKTKAIADAEARVAQLGDTIKSLTATSSRLNEEIANLDAEVAKNEEALESATSLRRKQLAEFNEEEKDMLQSITSMKGAVSALSKHHEGASFLEVSGTDQENAAMRAAASIAHQLRKHHDLLAEVISPHQRKVVTAFLQSGATYAPQSGEIFGVINGMKESFESNLAASQREETDNNNAFEDLKAAKTSEIAAGKTLSDTKTQELATTDEKNALSKQDLEDTENTLESDVKFLSTVKANCADLDAQFAERTKTRQLEMEAVNKALSYLTSDDAHDLFTRTFNMALVQTSSMSRQQNAVFKVLMAAAKQTHDPKLVTLSMRIRLMKMDAVTMAIEAMVKPLEKQQQEEVDKRDFCVAEFNNNEATTASKAREHADAQAKLDDAIMTIDELTKTIDDLVKTIAECKTEMKRGSEDREKANKEFQVTVADQRATQRLLRGAKRALQKFYKDALVQTGTATTSGQTPPMQFKTYDRSKGGIVGVIQGVLDDAQKLEAEAIRGEEDGQKSYEDFVKDTNDALVVFNKDLVNKKEDKAKTEVEKTQTETELDGIKDEEAHLEQAKTDLHASCDYLMKNFDVRQAARHEEIEAMKMAIHITGGAPIKEFLQMQ